MAVPSLNDRAAAVCRSLADDASAYGASVSTVGAARVIDCGVEAPGSLAAGRMMARACLADLGTVSIAPGEIAGRPVPELSVEVAHPVAACMASQYAGWQVSVGDYFAMGSGPMRAAYGKEPLYDAIGFRERPNRAVGALETGKLPDEAVVSYFLERTGVPAPQLTLLAAPTASLAGTAQVVARSVETALHKLHELGFDIARVVSGFGHAPVPPVAGDDLAAIGRSNDAVLYGGRVVLAVRGDDESLAETGPRVPSSASRDHGRPFAEIFDRAGGDFYQLDPMLFSPAVVAFENLDTGRSHCFGERAPGVLGESFFS